MVQQSEALFFAATSAFVKLLVPESWVVEELVDGVAAGCLLATVVQTRFLPCFLQTNCSPYAIAVRPTFLHFFPASTLDAFAIGEINEKESTNEIAIAIFLINAF